MNPRRPPPSRLRAGTGDAQRTPLPGSLPEKAGSPAHPSASDREVQPDAAALLQARAENSDSPPHKTSPARLPVPCPKSPSHAGQPTKKEFLSDNRGTAADRRSESNNRLRWKQ